MNESEVAALVKRLRKRLHLTQERFAQRIGVTYSTVNQWENGKRIPHGFLLEQLVQMERESVLEEPRSAAEPRSKEIPGAVHEIVARIVARFQPERVILFGSYARGDARADSDVDLLVVMPVRGSKREAQLKVRQSLRDIRVPKDVVVTTPEDFEWRQHVPGTIEHPAAREGRLLYARR